MPMGQNEVCPGWLCFKHIMPPARKFPQAAVSGRGMRIRADDNTTAAAEPEEAGDRQVRIATLPGERRACA